MKQQQQIGTAAADQQASTITNSSTTAAVLLLPNEEKACALQKSCDSCYKYSSVECHWCAFDHACHARASPYGCLVGSPCTNTTSTPPSYHPHPTKPPKSSIKKNCADFTNCKDCTLSSWECHWCQFDNKCHAVGSIYGCTYGVNCYSNQRCQRSTPQFVDGNTYSAGVHDILPPLVSIGSILITFCLLGCFTLCFLGARAMKGAYNDLVLNTAITTAEAVIDHQQSLSRMNADSVRHVQFCLDDNNNEDQRNDTEGVCSTDQQQGNEHDSRLLVPPSSHQQHYGDDEDDHSSLSQSLPLLQSTRYNKNDINNPNYNSTQTMTVGGASTMFSRRTVVPKSSNANSIMYICGFCYVILSIVVIFSNSLFLFYLPKIPVYNICSNELDWKSIVDGMTSGKIESSFQILFSIYNPNRFDVDINLGSGTFNHDGTYVGRFEIPPQTIIARQSISDLLLTVTLTPDKWEALALTAEYYKGTLTFEVAMSIDISIPFLGGYSYQANLDNYLVHLSDTTTERNLCSCPQWKDVKPHSIVQYFDTIEKRISV